MGTLFGLGISHPHMSNMLQKAYSAQNLTFMLGFFWVFWRIGKQINSDKSFYKWGFPTLEGLLRDFRSLDSKGRITIPKKIIEKLGLTPLSCLQIEEYKGKIVITVIQK